MIIAGQDDLKTNKEARRKKRKRNYKKPAHEKIVRNPDTVPWVYIPYGRCPYIVVAYGIVRSHMRNEWFAIYDFYMFQEKRWLMKKLNDLFRQLVNAGYLDMRPVEPRTILEKLGNGQTRMYRIAREYRITPRALRAITTVAKLHREKMEREARRTARRHGQNGAALRWADDTEN